MYQSKQSPVTIKSTLPSPIVQTNKNKIHEQLKADSDHECEKKSGPQNHSKQIQIMTVWKKSTNSSKQTRSVYNW